MLGSNGILSRIPVAEENASPRLLKRVFNVQQRSASSNFHRASINNATGEEIMVCWFLEVGIRYPWSRPAKSHSAKRIKNAVWVSNSHSNGAKIGYEIR